MNKVHKGGYAYLAKVTRNNKRGRVVIHFDPQQHSHLCSQFICNDEKVTYAYKKARVLSMTNSAFSETYVQYNRGKKIARAERTDHSSTKMTWRNFYYDKNLDLSFVESSAAEQEIGRASCRERV